MFDGLTMDGIVASLQLLLRERFHVTPTATARHDQWFKRVYQSWVEKDKELLLLTPKVPRAEWAPEMLQLSAQLARHIQTLAAAERQRLDASSPPRPGKLFPDSVLDEPPLMCPLADRQALALSPRMQRGDWWPAKSLVDLKDLVDLVDLADVVKALLEHEQIAALVHVAQMRDVYMEDAADIGNHWSLHWRWSREKRRGWGTVVDEALAVFFFSAIVGAFPEELLTENNKYTNWLPYGELLPGSPPMRFVEALKKRPGFKGLPSTDILYHACRLPGVDWESRISGAMLYFIGFEAWNRAREGNWYLRCHFNTTKNDRWLARGMKASENRDTVIAADNTGSAPKAKLVRPRDPLRLHEPRVEPEDSDSDKEEQDRLAELERSEAAYGFRRSTKYQRRKVRD